MPGTTVPEQTAEQTAYHDPIAALPAPDHGAPRHAVPVSPTPDSPEPDRSSRAAIRARKYLLLLLIVAAVGGAIWKIRKNRAETAATPTGRAAMGGGGPTPVLVAPVQQRTVPIYLTALGTVTPYNSVTIKSRVDGQLLSVPVREGQRVSKGQVLAEIDPRPYQAALAQAQGQLVKDQANAANYNAEAQRYKSLYAAGVISKESQDAQISNAGQATGSIEADEAAIQAAKVNVAYTRITSPINGVVGLRMVDPGNIVHAADTTGLLLVTQVQPIAVIFTLPEDQLPQVLKLVREGVKLTVEAYDRSETTHLATGTLLTVDNQIDTTTGTARIKAVFPNTDNALFPNQFVNVRLIVQDRQNALVVPAAALQTATSGNFLYVVRQGNPPPGLGDDSSATGGSGRRSRTGEASSTAPAGESAAPSRPAGPRYYAQAVPVKVDLTQGNNVILDSGVNPGDLVVVDGQERLKNGGRVVPHQSENGAAVQGSRNGGIGASSANPAVSAPRTPAGAGVTGPAATPPSGSNGNGSTTTGAAGSGHNL
jgi:multidrug efflux system membrane fusion protein